MSGPDCTVEPCESVDSVLKYDPNSENRVSNTDNIQVIGFITEVCEAALKPSLVSNITLQTSFIEKDSSVDAQRNVVNAISDSCHTNQIFDPNNDLQNHENCKENSYKNLLRHEVSKAEVQVSNFEQNADIGIEFMKVVAGCGALCMEESSRILLQFCQPIEKIVQNISDSCISNSLETSSAEEMNKNSILVKPDIFGQIVKQNSVERDVPSNGNNEDSNSKDFKNDRCEKRDCVGLENRADVGQADMQLQSLSDREMLTTVKNVDNCEINIMNKEKREKNIKIANKKHDLAKEIQSIPNDRNVSRRIVDRRESDNSPDNFKAKAYVSSEISCGDFHENAKKNISGSTDTSAKTENADYHNIRTVDSPGRQMTVISPIITDIKNRSERRRELQVQYSLVHNRLDAEVIYQDQSRNQKTVRDSSPHKYSVEKPIECSYRGDPSSDKFRSRDRSRSRKRSCSRDKSRSHYAPKNHRRRDSRCASNERDSRQSSDKQQLSLRSDRGTKRRSRSPEGSERSRRDRQWPEQRTADHNDDTVFRRDSNITDLREKISQKKSKPEFDTRKGNGSEWHSGVDYVNREIRRQGSYSGKEVEDRDKSRRTSRTGDDVSFEQSRRLSARGEEVSIDNSRFRNRDDTHRENEREWDTKKINRPIGDVEKREGDQRWRGNRDEVPMNSERTSRQSGYSRSSENRERGETNRTHDRKREGERNYEQHDRGDRRDDQRLDKNLEDIVGESLARIRRCGVDSSIEKSATNISRNDTLNSTPSMEISSSRERRKNGGGSANRKSDETNSAIRVVLSQNGVPPPIRILPVEDGRRGHPPRISTFVKIDDDSECEVIDDEGTLDANQQQQQQRRDSNCQNQSGSSLPSVALNVHEPPPIFFQGSFSARTRHALSERSPFSTPPPGFDALSAQYSRCPPTLHQLPPPGVPYEHLIAHHQLLRAPPPGVLLRGQPNDVCLERAGAEFRLAGDEYDLMK